MTSSSRSLIAIILIIVLLILAWSIKINSVPTDWSAEEIKILQSLSLNKLPPLPKDYSNAVADNLLAAEFGKELFFDSRFSHNSKISCATCHIPDLYFTDGLATAAGAQAGVRNSPSLVGVAHSAWQFWDGRSDSQWSQALAPLENTLEHASTRTHIVNIIFTDEDYRAYYQQLFGPLPNLSDIKYFSTSAAPTKNKDANESWLAISKEDRNTITLVYVNVAKCIAAYQRLLQPGSTRFDDYVEGVINNDKEKISLFNNDEIVGLKLFIGKAQCVNCHNGPLLTNHEFHNTGILSAARQLPSLGRATGIRTALADPFNCIGEYSDATMQQCADLRFAKSGDELIGAHKVPTLRNVSATAPYMHAGQLDTLETVIEHYDQAPTAMVGHNEIKPLELSNREKKQLVAFLNSLTGPLDTDTKWLINPHN